MPSSSGSSRFRLIALSSSGITTALTSWITESSSDVIATVGVGTVERLTTHGYSASGRLLASTRVWHTIQIAAYWYDFLHRATTKGDYGTNAAATFNRSGLSEPPSSSSSVLVTKYRYDDTGELDRVTDPNGRHVVTTFDQAGRVRKTIENYVDGTPGSSEDEDRTTEYTYEYPTEGYGLIRKIIARRVSSGDDQTTTYKYGVRTSSDYTSSTHLTAGSDINAGNLLGSVVYPQTDSTDRIATFKYHQWGLLLKEYKDPAGNTVTMETSDYDFAKRELRRTLAKASGSAFDNTVTSITRKYGANGKLATVTQHSGNTLLDTVTMTYDGWGNVEDFEQDPLQIENPPRDSMIVSSSYEKATSGRNVLRRTLQKLKTGSTYGYEIGFSYSSSGGLHDSDASRVSAVTVNATGSPVTVAEYDYLGFDHVVGVRYTAPATDIERKFYGSTSGSYTSFDQFDRLIKDAWKKNGGREFYSLTVAYDSNSNVTSTDDAEPATGYDVKYTMDNLDRLTQADEGTLSGSSITSGTRDEQWTLSALGNATTHILDLDHNGSYGGTGELNENNPDTGSSPYFNKANELRTRDPDNNNTENYTLTYDANGNLTSDGVNYKYEYDTLNRLRRVRDINDTDPDTNLVAEYWYNGLGYRIAMRTDVTGSGGVPDGNANSTDPIYYLVYDPRWRQVATYRSTDSYPKEQFVHHAAGSDGSGSYVDSIILRDRDSDTAWASTADSAREDRVYYCQNRRADVVALVADSGRILETVKYSAYGVPLLLNPADYNRDGYVNGNDYDDFADDFDNAETSADVNFDGYVNGTDFDEYSEAWDYSGFVAGRGHLSAYNNTFGYAGYTWDPACSRYHVRNRVYAPELARWLTRDPLGYIDGDNLYEYVASIPLQFRDPSGLIIRDTDGDWKLDRPPRTPIAPTPTVPVDLHIYDPNMSSGNPLTDKVFGDQHMLLCCINGMIDEGGDIAPAESVDNMTSRIRIWKKLNPGKPLRRIKLWDHGAPGTPFVGPDVIIPGTPETNALVGEMGPGCQLCFEGCNIGYGKDGQGFQDSWNRHYPNNPIDMSPSLGIVNPFPFGPTIIRVPARKKKWSYR